MTLSSDTWAMFTGTFLPPLIAVIQQRHWSNQVRTCVAVGICILVGIGTAYFTNQLQPNQIASNIFLVMGFAMTTYRNVWKPAGVTPTVEDATSIAPTQKDGD